MASQYLRTFERVPVNKELLTGTVPVNKNLLTGTVLVNNLFFIHFLCRSMAELNNIVILVSCIINCELRSVHISVMHNSLQVPLSSLQIQQEQLMKVIGGLRIYITGVDNAHIPFTCFSLETKFIIFYLPIIDAPHLCCWLTPDWHTKNVGGTLKTSLEFTMIKNSSMSKHLF